MKKHIITLLFVISALCMVLPIVSGSNGSSPNESNAYLELEGSYNEIIPLEKISKNEISDLNYQMSSENDFCWPWQTCYESQYVADGWETNNSLGSARFVGDALSVNRTSIWRGTLHDVSADEDDIDYYKFHLNTNRRIQVQLKNIPEGTNYNLYLWQKTINIIIPEYTLLGYSFNTSNSNEYIYTSEYMPAGDYIICVNTVDGLSSSEYDIYLSARANSSSLSYRGAYNYDKEGYDYRIIKFTPDFSKSYTDTTHTMENAYFIPYQVLYMISNFVNNEDRLSQTNSILGMDSDNDFYLQIIGESALGLVVSIALYGASGPASIYIGSYFVLDALADYLDYLQDKAEYLAVFEQALAAHKGLYILNDNYVYSR